MDKEKEKKYEKWAIAILILFLLFFTIKCIFGSIWNIILLIIILVTLWWIYRRKKEEKSTWQGKLIIIILIFLLLWRVVPCVLHEVGNFGREEDAAETLVANLEKAEQIAKEDEEKRKIEEEQRKVEEEKRRIEEEKRRAEEEQKRLEEQKKREEEQRKLAEQLAKKRAAEAEEKKKAEQAKAQSTPAVNYSVDRDCSDFSRQGEATSFMKASIAAGFGDHRLDRDGDGIACDD